MVSCGRSGAAIVIMALLNVFIENRVLQETELS